MPQPNAIDIADWREDEVFGLVYPEGARPKRAIFSPARIDLPFIKPSWRYLFKRSSRRYREQFWAEIVAYEVGLLLGIPVPPAYAAFDSRTEQCGALSEWFYQEGQDGYVAAGHLFQRTIPDFDRGLGTQHNLTDALRFSRLAGDAGIVSFMEALLFDSLIGNTDRHQDNWGFLMNAKAVAADEDAASANVRLAPWFDNGTSLGHERYIEHVTGWTGDDYSRYINKGKHHLRESRHNDIRLNQQVHMRQVAEKVPVMAKYLLQMLNRFDFLSFRTTLDHLVGLDMPELGKLSSERANFMYELTYRRYIFLQEALS